jgi:hypothetical protein
MPRSALLLPILFSVATSAGWTSSLTPRGTEGIKRAEVKVFTGGGLAATDAGAFLLFGGDSNRANRFEVDLRSAITDRLRQSGIMVEAGAKSGFGVSVYGRPVDDQRCSDRYVVLIKFYVYNEKYHDDQPVVEMGRLEVPTEQDLEKDLKRVVLLLLDETLTNSRRE